MKNPSFDLSPEEIRRLGYLAADAVAEHREKLDRRPVFGKVGAAASLFEEPVPEDGMPFEEVFAFVREHILPFPMGNSHPRFYGFINATADPVGITADYMAAAMNPNCWGGITRRSTSSIASSRGSRRCSAIRLTPRESSFRAAPWRISRPSRPRAGR